MVQKEYNVELLYHDHTFFAPGGGGTGGVVGGGGRGAGSGFGGSPLTPAATYCVPCPLFPRLDTLLLRKHIVRFELTSQPTQALPRASQLRQHSVAFRVGSLNEAFKLMPPSETPGPGPAPQQLLLEVASTPACRPSATATTTLREREDPTRVYVSSDVSVSVRVCVTGEGVDCRDVRQLWPTKLVTARRHAEQRGAKP